MKHVRRDRTFVYYYHSGVDGSSVGIRVGRTHAWVIAGNGKNPEKFVVEGSAQRLPLNEQRAAEEFLNVRDPLIADHPELNDLLRGEKTLADMLAQNDVLAQDRGEKTTPY